MPRRLILLALALVVASCAFGPPARARTQPAAGPILLAASASASARALDRDLLWQMNPGSRPLQVPLHGNVGMLSALARSPDGRRIAYVLGGRSLWQMDGNGDNLRLLYALPADAFGQVAAPRYTPDGNTVSFTAGCCANFAIDSVGVDGKHPRKLLSGGVRFLQDWSPDGRSLLFTLNGALWVADAQGRRAHPLGGDAPDAGSFSDARYSPDGSHIVATLLPAQGEEAGARVLALMHTDGQYLTILTNDLGTDASQPTWSADGKRIAFMATTGALGPLGQLHDLWIMRYDGSGKRNLTRGTLGDVSAVAWAR